jgi:ubiquinone/menaquinone biosynthesis C-methylase UbiE
MEAGRPPLEAAARFIGAKGRVHAFDVDPNTIEQVRAQIKTLDALNIEATVADATKRLPLLDASIDTCIIANVLHGFVVNKEVDIVFKELRRVMKAGGKIAIVDFKKKKYLPGPPYEERLAPVDVETLLSKLGGPKPSSFNAGALHYCLDIKVP